MNLSSTLSHTRADLRYIVRGGFLFYVKGEQFQRQALLHSAEQQAQALRSVQRHFGDRGAFGGWVAGKEACHRRGRPAGRRAHALHSFGRRDAGPLEKA